MINAIRDHSEESLAIALYSTDLVRLVVLNRLIFTLPSQQLDMISFRGE